jgi:hypothetical protein
MLTLIIPGLIWPYQALLDLTSGLTPSPKPRPQNTPSLPSILPAFSTLLGRGKLTHLPPATVHQAVAHRLGLPTPLPAAALRELALHAAHAVNTPTTNTSHVPGSMLCLDPVHLSIEQTRLRVDDPQHLALSMAEAETIAVSLAPTFSTLGTLTVLTPNAWNLHLHAHTPALNFPLAPPLPESIARAAPPLSARSAAASWRQAINEANMILHTHPVNLSRSGQGKPTVNSLWPWGAGALPTGLNTCKHLSVDRIHSHDLVIQGAARSQNIAYTPSLSIAELKPKEHALYILDALDLPARTGDTYTWRAALLQLEKDWFVPLLQALHAGHIPQIQLIAPGDEASITLSIKRYQLWQFWRKPAPMTVLATPTH